MIFKNRNDFDSNFDWLYYLQNDLGCNDLMIACSGKNKEGEIWFSRRYNFLELQNLSPFDRVYLNHKKTSWKLQKDFIKEASHRTILDIEVVFDIDDEPILEKAKRIMRRYREDNPACYFTGSKSYHIHIFNIKFRENKNLQKKKVLLLNLEGTDNLKCSSKHMIAIEGQPHYKSGKKKVVVNIDDCK